MSMAIPSSRTMLRIALLGLTVGWLAACEEEGPAERAGEQMDDAVEETGEALEDTGDAVDDAADDATNQ